MHRESRRFQRKTATMRGRFVILLPWHSDESMRFISKNVTLDEEFEKRVENNASPFYCNGALCFYEIYSIFWFHSCGRV